MLLQQGVCVMSRLFIYCRVSTSNQTDNTSFSTQEERCRAYCAAHGHDVVDVMCETMSGKSFDDRVQVKSVIDRINAGEADGIIVLRLDRLSRSTRDILDLADQFQKSGKTMIFVENNLDTGTPMGKAMLTIFSAMAQLEREMIVARCNAGRAAKKAAGGRIGGTAQYGYTLDWEPVEEQQSVIQHMRDLRSQGLTLREIAAELNEEGVPSMKNGKWMAATVGNILNRE